MLSREILARRPANRLPMDRGVSIISRATKRFFQRRAEVDGVSSLTVISEICTASALYLLRIPTMARTSRLFLEWNWAMSRPPDISHFGYRRSLRRNLPATALKETLVSVAPPA
jgi:hypothetical protein